MTDGPDWPAIAARGLLDVAEESAADRRALIEFLVEQGCTIEEMERAHARGRLFALVGDRILHPGGSVLSLAQVADRLGLEEPVVRAVWRSLGLTGSTSSDPVASEADARALQVMADAQEFVGLDRVLELSRAVASSLSRIGEAANAIGRSVGPDGSVATSGSEEATARFWAVTAPTVTGLGGLLAALLPYHFEMARDHFERSDSYDLLLSGMVRIGVGFIDLTGFTAMTEQLAAEEFGGLIRSFAARVEEAVADRGGRVVKFIGDAAMFVGPDAVTLGAIATDLVLGEALVDLGLNLHAGLAFGEVLCHDGDYFGSPVNLAARLAGLADPGLILASDAVGAALESSGCPVDWHPPRSVRGFADPLTTCSVVPGSGVGWVTG